MPIKKPKTMATGLTAPDAYHRIEYIGANAAEVSGTFSAYVSEVAAGDGSEALDGQPVARILVADQSDEVKQALLVIRAALEAAAVADDGAAAIVKARAIPEVLADPDEGIEAAPAIAAVKAVPARPPGALYGGKIV